MSINVVGFLGGMIYYGCGGLLINGMNLILVGNGNHKLLGVLGIIDKLHRLV